MTDQARKQAELEAMASRLAADRAEYLARVERELFGPTGWKSCSEQWRTEIERRKNAMSELDQERIRRLLAAIPPPSTPGSCCGRRAFAETLLGRLWNRAKCLVRLPTQPACESDRGAKQ